MMISDEQIDRKRSLLMTCAYQSKISSPLDSSLSSFVRSIATTTLRKSRWYSSCVAHTYISDEDREFYCSDESPIRLQSISKGVSQSAYNGSSCSPVARRSQRRRRRTDSDGHVSPTRRYTTSCRGSRGGNSLANGTSTRNRFGRGL